MNICPDCYLEVTDETRQCPDCGTGTVPADMLTLELEWPHCAGCGEAATESANRCAECGKRFYPIPVFPQVAAFLAAVATFLIFAFLLDKMGFTTNTMKITGILAGAMVWYLLRRRTNLVLKAAPVSWSALSRNVRDALRLERKK